MVHMVTAAYLTTAFVVGGIGAFYLWRKLHVKHARIMLGMAMIMAIFVAPVQLLFGDLHGLNTFKHQPAKVAAMEGLWETTRGAPLLVFGWPDMEEEITRYAVKIPKLSSLILTHDFNGEVAGLKAWPKDERPPAAMVFWSFRVMVGLGMLMIATGFFGLFLYWKKHLFDTKWFQILCMALTPAGFLCVLSGWFVTEVGRQPWVVYGFMRTAEAISPVPGSSIALTLTAFILVYGFIFGAGSYFILKLIAKGPEIQEEAYGSHGMKKPPIMTEILPEKGGRNV